MEALQAVARLGPFFTVSLPGTQDAGVEWQPFTALATDAGAQLLRAQVDALSAQLDTQPQRPVASLLHLGAAASLTSPLLAVAAAYGFVPDVRPEQLRFGYCARGRLQLTLAQMPAAGYQAMLPALATDLIEVALERLLGTFTAALTAAVPLPEATVTGNALSALAAAARLIEPVGAGYRARALVDLIARRHGPLREAGVLAWRNEDVSAYFRRRNCCLFYQVPGAGTCGDCVLDPR